MIRVVLDTNLLVSALLFEKCRLAWMLHGWQGGMFTPVLAQPTTLELFRVLGHPKFGFTPRRDRTAVWRAAALERNLERRSLGLMEPLCRPAAVPDPPGCCIRTTSTGSYSVPWSAGHSGLYSVATMT
jgi:hypothetical protein